MNTRSPRCIGNTEGSNLADEGKHTPERQRPTITFSDYVLSINEGENLLGMPQLWPDNFRGCLILHSDIRSLPGLLRWARERYPDFYHRRAFLPNGEPGGPTGMTRLHRAWAEYLRRVER